MSGLGWALSGLEWTLAGLALAIGAGSTSHILALALEWALEGPLRLTKFMFFFLIFFSIHLLIMDDSDPFEKEQSAKST